MKISAGIVLVLLVVLASISSCGMDSRESGREFFVALDGSDDNPGTRDRPFATLEAARAAIRVTKIKEGLPPGGITVWLRGGIYLRTEMFALDSQDSGSKKAPVVYRAYTGEEVRLLGGRILDSAAFEPVTDRTVLDRIDPAARGNIIQVDLQAQGITEYGVMKPFGFPQSILPTAMELFFEKEPMTLARWPNEGYVKTGKVLSTGSIPRQGDFSDKGGRFIFDDERIKRWKNTDNIWLYGYWCWDWAEEALNVSGIDFERREIALGMPHHYGIKEGKRFFAFNLLEEIDMLGEWYLDRTKGILYFWPPGPVEQAEIAVSMLEDPMISIKNASHITFRDMVFENMRGTVVQIVGGAHNLVAGCTFRNIGNVAVMIGDGTDGEVVGEFGCSSNHRSYINTIWNRNGGTGHGIVGCDIYQTGEGGLIIGGGERPLLKPAGNYAVNNHIHDFCRRRKTNSPAIWLDGVGNIAACNLIHDAPHTGIMFWGNEHRIEYNEIHDVCRETDDVGVIYTGRDWTGRGHLVRYNYIHDIKGVNSAHGAMGIYLDDAASGVTVYGNIIHNLERRAVLVGGGRDNVVENNIMINCTIPVHVDDRGLGWMKGSVVEGGTLRTRLDIIPYRQDPWKKRYPELVDILSDDPGAPKGNIVRNNVMKNCGSMNIADTARAYGTIENNHVLHLTAGEDAGEVDTDEMIVRLIEQSLKNKAVPGFKQILFQNIGLYRDEYRQELPLHGNER